MKRILFLAVAAAICILFVCSAAACAAAADSSVPSDGGEAIVSSEAAPADGTEDADEIKEDGINLKVTTTAIVVACALVTVGVIVFVVVLGRRNNGQKLPVKK